MAFLCLFLLTLIQLCLSTKIPESYSRLVPYPLHFMDDLMDRSFRHGHFMGGGMRNRGYSMPFIGGLGRIPMIGGGFRSMPSYIPNFLNPSGFLKDDEPTTEKNTGFSRGSTGYTEDGEEFNKSGKGFNKGSEEINRSNEGPNKDGKGLNRGDEEFNRNGEGFNKDSEEINRSNEGFNKGGKGRNRGDEEFNKSGEGFNKNSEVNRSNGGPNKDGKGLSREDEEFNRNGEGFNKDSEEVIRSNEEFNKVSKGTNKIDKDFNQNANRLNKGAEEFIMGDEGEETGEEPNKNGADNDGPTKASSRGESIEQGNEGNAVEGRSIKRKDDFRMDDGVSIGFRNALHPTQHFMPDAGPMPSNTVIIRYCPKTGKKENVFHPGYFGQRFSYHDKAGYFNHENPEFTLGIRDFEVFPTPPMVEVPTSVPTLADPFESYASEILPIERLSHINENPPKKCPCHCGKM